MALYMSNKINILAPCINHCWTELNNNMFDGVKRYRQICDDFSFMQMFMPRGVVFQSLLEQG